MSCPALRMRPHIVGLALTLALLAVACRSTSEPRYHDLTSPRPVNERPAERCAQLQVTVAPPYDGRAIAYRVAAGQSLRWYQFERWNNGAEAVVMDGLERGLREAGVQTAPSDSQHCSAIVVVVERLEEVDVDAGTKSAEAWAEVQAEFQIDGGAVVRYSGRHRAEELEVPSLIRAFGTVIEEFAAVMVGRID